MITEVSHILSDDQRHDLLFLTGGMKVFRIKDLDKSSRWNINEYFGFNGLRDKKLLKVIIKKNEVITKMWIA